MRPAEAALHIRANQQQVVAHLGQFALIRPDITALLDETVRVVAHTLEVELAQVLELLPDGQSLLLRAGVGWRAGLVGRATVGTETQSPAGSTLSQAGYTVLTDKPVIVDDLRTDPRFSGTPLLIDHGVISGLSVTIWGQSRSDRALGAHLPTGDRRPYGVLGAHTTKGRRFTQDDTHFLQSIANIIAAAISRALAEQALQTSEQRFRFLSASTPIGICEINTAGLCTYTNPSWQEITGLTLDESLGAGWKATIHPEDQPAFEAPLAGALEAAGRISVEARVYRPNGEVRWVRSHLAPLQHLEGQAPRGLVGTIEDITGQKASEERLREQTRLFALTGAVGNALARGAATQSTLQQCAEAVIRHTGAAVARIWVLNRTENVLDMQASAGLDTDREGPPGRIPVGLRTIGRIAADARAQVTNHVTDDLQAPDLAWARQEGLVAFAGYPLIVEGQVFGVLALFARQPLTETVTHTLASVADTIASGIERRQAEEDLRESNRQLMAAVSELQQTQALIVQQERLRALGQMASGIAHDLNNALVPVVGFSQLLQENTNIVNDPAKLDRYLDLIKLGAEDAANVVGRLREFYRERGTTEELGPANLNRLVEQAVLLTKPRWKDQALADGLTIQVQSDLAETPPIAGSETELREALTNLILNAVDALPAGGTITLRTRVEPDQIIVEVGDTGVGMSEEVRQRCLEPFFTTKGERGTGLGLSMVYGTVQRHQGTLHIVSEPGGGTTFRLGLPAAAAPVPSRPAEPLGATLAACRILVVDDEPGVRQLVTAYLVRDGHSVDVACNGVDGLNRFRAGRHDLVITDRSMPKMNGDKLALAVKALSPTTPVILLTGFGDVMEATGEHPAGVDIVAAKPIRLLTLRRIVARARSQAPAGVPAARDRARGA